MTHTHRFPSVLRRLINGPDLLVSWIIAELLRDEVVLAEPIAYKILMALRTEKKLFHVIVRTSLRMPLHVN